MKRFKPGDTVRRTQPFCWSDDDEGFMYTGGIYTVDKVEVHGGNPWLALKDQPYPLNDTRFDGGSFELVVEAQPDPEGLELPKWAQDRIAVLERDVEYWKTKAGLLKDVSSPRRQPTNKRATDATRKAWGDWLAKFADDPEGAALAAGYAIDVLQKTIEDVGEVRAKAVRQLRAEGHSLGDEVARMEVGAGYEAVTVDVANAAGPATYRAVVFGWPADRRHGAPVESNDWLAR